MGSALAGSLSVRTSTRACRSRSWRRTPASARHDESVVRPSKRTVPTTAATRIRSSASGGKMPGRPWKHRRGQVIEPAQEGERPGPKGHRRRPDPPARHASGTCVCRINRQRHTPGACGSPGLGSTVPKTRAGSSERSPWERIVAMAEEWLDPLQGDSELDCSRQPAMPARVERPREQLREPLRFEHRPRHPRGQRHGAGPLDREEDAVLR